MALSDVLNSKIRNCTSCRLHTHAHGPVPYAGPLPARVVVIGEAPSQVDAAEGEPFAGAAGKLLKSMLHDARIDPHQVGYLNAVSCFPGRSPKKKAPRAPSSHELDRCAPNLFFQLRLAKPTVVVLAGGVALSTFRPDLQISRDRGRPMMRKGWGSVVVPTYHPAAILRAKHLQEVVRKDLRQARWRLRKVEITGWGMDRWPEECRQCGKGVEVYDPDGVAWCGRHGETAWDGQKVVQPELV